MSSSLEIKNELSSKYTVWYHKSKDTNWSLKSYKKIHKFGSIQSFWTFFLTHSKNTSGMYFIMKENVMPIWEDKNNINGYTWSFKISKLGYLDIWEKVLTMLIGNTLTENLDHMNIINGASITMRLDSCIIKIWCSSSKDIKLNKDIYTELGEAFMQEHKKRQDVQK